MGMYLSKSKYCDGVTCPKILWLKKNKPELFDASVMKQSVLETGNKVGDLAMGLFGEYVEVTTIDDNGKLNVSKMIERTNEELSISMLSITLFISSMFKLLIISIGLVSILLW